MINLAQRLLLVVALVAVAVLVMFPPWLITYNPPRNFLYTQKATRNAGYHLIFAPPVVEDRGELSRMFGLPNDNAEISVLSPNYFSTAIDKDRLAIQLVGVLIIAALLVFLLKSKSS